MGKNIVRCTIKLSIQYLSYVDQRATHQLGAFAKDIQSQINLRPLISDQIEARAHEPKFIFANEGEFSCSGINTL